MPSPSRLSVGGTNRFGDGLTFKVSQGAPFGIHPLPQFLNLQRRCVSLKGWVALVYQLYKLLHRYFTNQELFFSP